MVDDNTVEKLTTSSQESWCPVTFVYLIGLPASITCSHFMLYKYVFHKQGLLSKESLPLAQLPSADNSTNLDS